ncbi:MAG: hypothetical protein US45_C0046G0005 [Candidatus Nomurabacteria bacterium GW2011_GWA1_37_20]|uniref:Uncharacterized protein n=1 Tax=Candidatus Nomurabacteria bacterium GW2011_GWA1_37_20 TaxID=1618729 RepID=A0A0G0JRH6_9BACT|nr:MAG: hypothetical protein US33_C0025G0008 [Parcubacteria group bacterium GW2011_GWC1_36_9]KKQ26781.1 MAG: hypothetical protein US41_C0033G0005 [Parcubacteria group bacterium GW2011_GWB1_37_13]KKQ30726.1 MAG: hypothetical protein US45_C0046G0005 [Candidatus Nomurabacteria bacterium GW2011_GWA1_37_20]
MEKQPKFLKDFTKKYSQKERDETAQSIRAKRSESFQRKKEIGNREEVLEGSIFTHKVSLEKQEKEIQRLRAEIDDLNKNFPQRLLNYFKLKQVRADLDVASQKKDKAVTGVRKNEEEKDRVKRSKERIPEGFESASRILEDFYTSQKHT